MAFRPRKGWLGTRTTYLEELGDHRTEHRRLLAKAAGLSKCYERSPLTRISDRSVAMGSYPSRRRQMSRRFPHNGPRQRHASADHVWTSASLIA
jgi:hypothetical protein